VGVPGESRLPPYPFIARAYAGCQGWADLRTAKVSHGAAWFVSNTFDMESRLVRNGSVLCDLVPSVLHAGVPTGLEGHWYDCTLVTRSRITPEASDIFEVVSSDGVFHLSKFRGRGSALKAGKSKAGYCSNGGRCLRVALNVAPASTVIPCVV